MKAEATTARILILGNPNVGKSSLFNALTGGRQHIVNAPGTTLDVAKRTWASACGDFDVWDLPGTYSLIALAPDEDVVARAVADATADRRSPSSSSTQPPLRVPSTCSPKWPTAAFR